MSEDRPLAFQGVERSPQPAVTPLRPVGRASRAPSESVTTFVGRARELREIRARLQREDVRLLTLSGSGGVGKTRLAIRAGIEAGGAFVDGVWFVSLVAVHDPALVLPTIARTFGLRESGDRPVSGILADFLGSQQALLILDNFERVIDAGPTIIDLLAACPALTVLVTSRIVLSVSGEHVYTVPPLSIPAEAHGRMTDHVGDVEAVRLFVDRAVSSSSSFALTDANAATVAEICRRLDGLPLALELAAARMASLSPAALLSLLEHRLTLLTHGMRDAPPRHRSMREAIAWSHDLLTEEDQRAFRCLAVFTGGFTLSAAQAVLGGTGTAYDTIDSLVARSMLVPVEGVADDPRFIMLETLREYGLERLDAVGEEAAARERHAAYYLSLAERTDWCWFMPAAEGDVCLKQLYADEANIRAALGWFREQGDVESMLRMAGRLGPLWVVCGRTREGLRWLEDGLAQADGVPEYIRTRAMVTLSWTVNTSGDGSRALALAEEALSRARMLDQVLTTTQALILCGVPATRLGQFDHAVARFDEAADILQSLDEPNWIRNALITVTGQLGLVALTRGDIDRAEAFYRAASAMQRERECSGGESHIYAHIVSAGLGDIARARGEDERAIGLYQESLLLGWRYRNLRSIDYAIGGIAGALAALGKQALAARLFGACESVHLAYGFNFALETFDRQRALGLPEPWARADTDCGEFQHLRESLRSRPVLPPIADPEAASEQWMAGRQLALETAVAEALAVRVERSAASSDDTCGLSARELDVLRLLVEGNTDAEIASALFISQRTAATHIRHIYDKLGVSSRAAAAALAVRRGLA